MLGGAVAILVAVGLVPAGCVGALCPSTVADPEPSTAIVSLEAAADGAIHVPRDAIPEIPAAGPLGPSTIDALFDTAIGPVGSSEMGARIGGRAARAGVHPPPPPPDGPGASGTIPGLHPTVERSGPTLAPALDQDGHAHGAIRRAATATGEALTASDGPAQAVGTLTAMAAIALYHRLTKERVLEHPARRRIRALLDAEPGLGTGEIADRLGVCYRTARHHLEKLAAFDLVVAHEGARVQRWSLPGDARQLVDPLREGEAAILALVAREPGLHLSAIARELEAAKATVKHRLDKLTDQGWVEDERVGPLRRFAITAKGARRLARP